MIKSCRFPAIDVVATGAILHVPAAGKLPSMQIVVASGTLHRRGAEIHVLQRRFQCRRPVAIGTRYRSVRAKQRKPGLGVIETVQLLPLDRGVACLASRRSTLRALCRHLLAELTGMRIGVACGAGAIFKAEFHRSD